MAESSEVERIAEATKVTVTSKAGAVMRVERVDLSQEALKSLTTTATTIEPAKPKEQESPKG